MFTGPRLLSTRICKLTTILFALIGCGRSEVSPEGNEITRRKSNPVRWSLMADEDTAGTSWGQLPGRLLYRAGRAWVGLASFYLEEHPGQTGFLGVTGQSLWATPCYFLFYKSWNIGTQSRQNRSRDQALSPAQTPSKRLLMPGSLAPPPTTRHSSQLPPARPIAPMAPAAAPAPRCGGSRAAAPLLLLVAAFGAQSPRQSPIALPHMYSLSGSQVLRELGGAITAGRPGIGLVGHQVPALLPQHLGAQQRRDDWVPTRRPVAHTRPGLAPPTHLLHHPALDPLSLGPIGTSTATCCQHSISNVRHVLRHPWCEKWSECICKRPLFFMLATQRFLQENICSGPVIPGLRQQQKPHVHLPHVLGETEKLGPSA
ncbi:hypothetical protein QTO34_015801 [Cnephaeus nilssonii]|uniref:Uncharacterized protein n=1 Tax=Cnephaeus nilssonii TaxID=3371016 RepID=A0AA40I518_CNENI|nr:hypothetical protein QTO34_015801 [Eptesicus nilssonii]